MSRALEETYTIGELAKCAGVTIRTVRYYCSEGLLPPPDTTGRYAGYSERHLCRLRYIGRLKNAYLPLSEIKARLAGLTTEEIQAYLDVDEESLKLNSLPKESAHRGQEAHTAAPDRTGDLPTELSHFVDETLSLSSDLPPNVPQRRRRVLLISPMLSPTTGRFSEMEETGDIAGGYLLDESRGETWKRIPLAPGVELHFRLPESPEAREALDRVIAQTQAAFKLAR